MTRTKILLAIFFAACITGNVPGQEILMTIDDKEITLDEFERIYNKNNNSLLSDQQSPEEYVDMFINFKLKVIEAENRGMDTTKNFLDEFNKYRDQLAAPYLTDEETKQKLIKEAYERMQSDIHVSHILLKLNSNSPEDTLAQYKKAMEIRQRLLDGEDFETVAKATSDDPSARINGGDLGFFTVFNMIYPFETAAYNLKDGEISMPVKTSYGYHIIKRIESRPAVGKIKVAHIFIRTPETMSDKEKEQAKNFAQAISDSLKTGASFEYMAKRYSDDQNSGKNGGMLTWFGPGRMVKEFEDQAFALKIPGDISDAFQSEYGWHIIKLVDKKPVGSFEEMLPELESQALKGDRDRQRRKIYLDKLKAEYDYKLNEDLYDKLYDIADTSLLSASWKPVRHKELYDKTLFSTKNGIVKITDFLSYLKENQKYSTPIAMEKYVDVKFNKFVEQYMLDAEKASLPSKYPEYKYILQEYHDGILLFDIMDHEVWSKAVEDTTGLEAFFNDHRSNYMWGERMDATIVSCDSTVDMEKVFKRASTIASGKWDSERLNKKYGNDKEGSITLKDVLVEEGVNEHIDALNKKPGIGNIYKQDGSSEFVILNKITAPSEKDLKDVRGQATSDYQDYLEKQWIKELREKYKVSVNKELLSKIKS